MQENSAQGTKAPDINPWTAIWTKPAPALDFVLRNQREEFLHRLFMAHGFFFMLMLRLPDWLTARPDPVGVMIQMLVVAPVVGITLGYLQANMLRWCYGWSGMKVESKLIRPLIAWTGMPFMLAIVVFLISYTTLNFNLQPAMRGSIWLFKAPEGMYAIGAGLLAGAYAVWVRVRAISLLFSLNGFKSIALWFAGFILTYVPFVLVVYLYFSIFYVTVIGPGR